MPEDPLSLSRAQSRNRFFIQVHSETWLLGHLQIAVLGANDLPGQYVSQVGIILRSELDDECIGY